MGSAMNTSSSWSNNNQQQQHHQLACVLRLFRSSTVLKVQIFGSQRFFLKILH